MARMRLPVLLKLVVVLANLCQALSVSNNSSGAVTWDGYSLIVNGERVFVKYVDCVQY